MSAQISAWAPTAQFKLASPPRSVVPEQRSARCAGRVLERRLGGEAAARSMRSERPLGPPSLSFVSGPGKPWSSTKHSPSMGLPSRTSKRSASRSKYETRRRPVRTTHVPTLVVSVFAPLPRRMVRRCDLLVPRHVATQRFRQSRRPPISAHRRRRPQYRAPEKAPSLVERYRYSAACWRAPIDRGAAQRTYRGRREHQANGERSSAEFSDVNEALVVGPVQDRLRTANTS
jgi:hypothetical protein